MSRIPHLHDEPPAPFQWPTMRMRRQLQAALFGGMRDMGIESDDERHRFLADTLGEDTFTALDDYDAGALIAELRRRGWWK